MKKIIRFAADSAFVSVGVVCALIVCVCIPIHWAYVRTIDGIVKAYRWIYSD